MLVVVGDWLIDRIDEKYLQSIKKIKDFQNKTEDLLITIGLFVIEDDESRLLVSIISLSISFVVWKFGDKSCSSNDLFDIGLLDGVTGIGTESFHWISPNWISIVFDEYCIVGCIDTGSCGIDDGVGRFGSGDKEVFFRLLSNVNDWVVPPMNSYSSVDNDVIGIISSFCFDDIISLEFIWLSVIGFVLEGLLPDE